MNAAYDARIRELETDVRKGQSAYENRLLTILLAANGTAMVLVFNAVVSGRLVGLCAFFGMVSLFTVGAATAFFALVRAYVTGRELNQLLAEAVMVAVNRSAHPTNDEVLAEALDHNDKTDRIDAINKRGKSFTWLLTTSGVLFALGIVASAVVVIDPTNLSQAH
jgi:hypothetical protein